MDDVTITPDCRVPMDELSFSASRSSGPGGQHVNKTSTRVTLLFDVARSPSLREDQRSLIRERLSSRINSSGVLRVVAQRERSQLANKELAIQRFCALLREALSVQTPRRPTRPSVAAEGSRLAEKRARGALKRDRAQVRRLLHQERDDEIDG